MNTLFPFYRIPFKLELYECLTNPSQDSSIGSISAWYGGGSGFKSRQGRIFSLTNIFPKKTSPHQPSQHKPIPTQHHIHTRCSPPHPIHSGQLKSRFNIRSVLVETKTNWSHSCYKKALPGFQKRATSFCSLVLKLSNVYSMKIQTRRRSFENYPCLNRFSWVLSIHRKLLLNFIKATNLSI